MTIDPFDTRGHAPPASDHHRSIEQALRVRCGLSIMNSRRVGIFVGGALALMLMALLAWWAHALALRAGLEQLRTEAQHRLDVLATRLEGDLARFDYLPTLLEKTPGIFELLAAPDDPALRLRVSRYLRGITLTAGADNLYVTALSGLTLAAGDWDQPGTPLGADLSFRPYVRDALAKGRGRFYGVGFTTGRAGYYLAYALQDQGIRRGVATVKVSLDATERSWGQLPGEVLVVDARGVVILASLSRWKLRPLTPLSPAMHADAAEARSYGSADLVPLDWHEVGRLDPAAVRVRVDSVGYLATERVVNQGLWRVVLLDEETPARETARIVAIAAALGGLVLLLAATALELRRRAVRQQLAARHALQAAHDSLEVKVLERTAELRAVQNDLIHAGKLAALGQMSAGVVHELNQPLAALRTLSDNAAVLIATGRLDDARGNLNRIGGLTERLGRLTQQLKVFAYKSSVPAQRVVVGNVVHDALQIVAARVREHDIAVIVSIEPADSSVWAEQSRLEQVLVNLMNNAIDATSGAPERRLEVRGARRGDCIEIAISDSGSGIHPDVLARLFEPFVTTKPVGKGLGLGLLISAHIVREFGGRLRARNLSPIGAEFVIELPALPHPSGESP